MHHNTGSVSLRVKCIAQCADEGLSEYIPNACGEYEWTRELIPIIFSPSTDPSKDLTQALSSAPAFSMIKIGRRPNCTIRLQDPSISGYHCKLIVVRAAKVKRSPSEERLQELRSANNGSGVQKSIPDVSCYLIDQSTNGTFVDNCKITKDVPALISTNQLVSLGKGKFDLAGDKLSHTFAFSIQLSSAGSGVVELEETSIGTREGYNSPLMGPEIPITRPQETQCPYSIGTSARVQTPQRSPDPSDCSSREDFFQSPSPNPPRRASPPLIARQELSNARLGTAKFVPTSACDSQFPINGSTNVTSGPIRSTSSSTTSGRLADLVKRLQVSCRSIFSIFFVAHLAPVFVHLHSRLHITGVLGGER